MAELEALLKAARYSLVPNALGYCGPKDAEPILRSFISEPTEEKVSAVESALRQFYGFYPYLELIASANSLEQFDESVVEAYWIGNRLLENVPAEALRKMVAEEFSKPGLLPKRIAQEKAERMPPGMLPHHSMHVLYINFITPKLKPLLENLSNCLVTWAEVKTAKENSAIVKTAKIVHECSELKLKETVKKINCKNFSGLQKGSLLSVHWGEAIEAIGEAQKKQMVNYTKKTLSALADK